MCFSPEMDLVAGLSITAVGIDALRQVGHRRQLALASIPLVLGLHQLVETFVWWELRGEVCQAAGDLATWLYLLIALVVVPVLVPVAFILLGLGRSARAGWGFLAAGVVAAVSLWSEVGFDTVGRRIDGHHIAYGLAIPQDYLVLPLYVAATCGPALLARSPQLRIFGLANLMAVAVIAWISQTAVISLWCMWAALTSVLINLHLRRRRRPGARAARVRPGSA